MNNGRFKMSFDVVGFRMGKVGAMSGVNSSVIPAFKSRLVCHCVICKHKGSRNAFYRPLPGKVPGFTDRCPNCGSNDIDVFDPDVYYRGNVAHEGSRLDE